MVATAISRRHNTLYVATDISLYLEPRSCPWAPNYQILLCAWRFHMANIHLKFIRSKTEFNFLPGIPLPYIWYQHLPIAQAKTESFLIFFFFSSASWNTLARLYHQYISRTTHFSPSSRPPPRSKATTMVQAPSACTAATASYKFPCFCNCFLYN